MNLNTFERLTLLNILPREGNITTLKIVRELNERVSFTAEEHESLKLTFSEDGKQVRWDRNADKEVEFVFNGVETKMIVERLESLNKAEKLTAEHLSLYEKFCES